MEMETNVRNFPAKPLRRRDISFPSSSSYFHGLDYRIGAKSPKKVLTVKTPEGWLKKKKKKKKKKPEGEKIPELS